MIITPALFELNMLSLKIEKEEIPKEEEDFKGENNTLEEESETLAKKEGLSIGSILKN